MAFFFIALHSWQIHLCSFPFPLILPIFIPSIIHSFIHTIIHSFILFFIHSYIHLLIHSFIHSFIPPSPTFSLRTFLVGAPVDARSQSGSPRHHPRALFGMDHFSSERSRARWMARGQRSRLNDRMHIGLKLYEMEAFISWTNASFHECLFLP